MKPDILLISSGQPSLNPRLVKEADALADAGYQVLVLYAYWNDWGTRYDELLLPGKKWKAVRVAGLPGDRRYWFSRLLFRLAKFVAKKWNRSGLLAEFALSRSTFFLITAAKKQQASLYIAHSLGALPAAVRAAEKYGKYCGFDAEDFHRDETASTAAEISLKSRIEDRYFPRLNYLTTSSPMITAAYQALYPNFKPLTILNAFSPDLRLQLSPPDDPRPLRLFWFSQTVGQDRGIEDVLQAIRLIPTIPFDLHLLGNATTAIKNTFQQQLDHTASRIFFHEPVHPDELILFAAQFDIGLALERRIPFNRDICLTNKLFVYLQAGLALIASETTAQSQFLAAYPDIGASYPENDLKTLAGLLTCYSQERRQLALAKSAAGKLGSEKLNWQTEAEKFLKLVGRYASKK